MNYATLNHQLQIVDNHFLYEAGFKFLRDSNMRFSQILKFHATFVCDIRDFAARCFRRIFTGSRIRSRPKRRPLGDGSSRVNVAITSTCLSISRLSRNGRNLRKILSGRTSITIPRHNLAIRELCISCEEFICTCQFPQSAFREKLMKAYEKLGTILRVRSDRTKDQYKEEMTTQECSPRFPENRQFSKIPRDH